MLSWLRNATQMHRRIPLGRMVNQSTMLLMVSIGFLILTLALLILFHENWNATKGYRLRKLEADRSASLLEQEVLNMQIAQAQALETLREDGQIQTMIAPKDVRYVDPAPKVVLSNEDESKNGQKASSDDEP